ncbi:hypothetical protein [Rhodobium gokarnense]|uniref:PpiC domain-containing protein n=1 Tax=Rhodobium gokarnense TaxID=364296 RepID=A0ABT3HG01_9HYPH|nr:hypothetical protein [Rhodobium gokarnense]MCW2309330.1 hypothetical protein [Rhodobium gokarnense]
MLKKLLEEWKLVLLSLVALVIGASVIIVVLADKKLNAGFTTDGSFTIGLSDDVRSTTELVGLLDADERSDEKEELVALLRLRSFYSLQDPAIIEAMRGLDNNARLARALQDMAQEGIGPFQTRVFAGVTMIAADDIQPSTAHYCAGSDFSRRSLTLARPTPGGNGSGRMLVTTVFGVQSRTCTDAEQRNRRLWVHRDVVAIASTDALVRPDPDRTPEALVAEIEARRAAVRAGEEVGDIEVQIRLISPIPSRNPNTFLASTQ